jgi:hypothetical protein
MTDHQLNQDIDFGGKPRQNKANNADNDGLEVIRLDEQQPLNDPNCEHNFKKDDDDLSDDFQAWVCTKCHRGTFLPKNVIIT